jgi:hypothetical protein
MLIDRIFMLLNDNNFLGDKCDKGIKFKIIQPRITDKPWFQNCNLRGDEIKTINRLISNHTYDKRWMHRFGKATSELCEKCQEIETAEHQIFICKDFDHSRMTFTHLSKVHSLQELWNSKVRHLILVDLVKFIRDNEIFF